MHDSTSLIDRVFDSRRRFHGNRICQDDSEQRIIQMRFLSAAARHRHENVNEEETLARNSGFEES